MATGKTASSVSEKQSRQLTSSPKLGQKEQETELRTGKDANWVNVGHRSQIRLFPKKLLRAVRLPKCPSTISEGQSVHLISKLTVLGEAERAGRVKKETKEGQLRHKISGSVVESKEDKEGSSMRLVKPVQFSQT